MRVGLALTGCKRSNPREINVTRQLIAKKRRNLTGRYFSMRLTPNTKIKYTPVSAVANFTGGF
jgi:hypothetical protein